MSLRLAGRLARRELRGGLRGFRIFLACLALGRRRHRCGRIGPICDRGRA